MTANRRVILGGAEVDLVDRDDALAVISRHLDDRTTPPLGVVSINLDHLHHLAADEAFARGLLPGSGIDWLSLIDGAPIAAEAGRLTGRPWPRLAGSDLIAPILDAIEASGARLGVLGGTADTHRLLLEQLAESRPALVVAGCWAPERAELADPASSARIAAEIADAGVDVLLVALGKPRQEKWIAEWGAATGSRVLLAFGAVVDFLAGRVARAPDAVARVGMEWAWRLAMEPRRLARRYLIDGPPSYLALRRHSAGIEQLRKSGEPAGATTRRFRPVTEAVDVAVVVVTYNSSADIERLLESLRDQSDHVTLRVIVVDNASSDGTLDLVRRHDDVVAIAAGGNLGYAGGINVAQPSTMGAETILVLNPDLAAGPDSVAALLARLRSSGAGAVVPLLRNAEGETSPSLRREPGVRRAFGDAVAGARWPGRPGWLSETDWAPVSYRYAHPVEWATGAALMVRADVAARVGAWDDRFFLYSEETDFFRRIRELGEQIWFEPSAVMEHAQGGSGTSDALLALMEVNKVRYVEKHGSAARAGLFRGTLVLHQLLRSAQSARRRAARTLLDRRSWGSLPAARRADVTTTGPVLGAVIIPAHNEAAVIARTLAPLAELAARGRIELLVAANGCRDDTVAVASRFDGVRVLDLPTPSKPAALREADLRATSWPRVYLDADVECPAASLVAVLDLLAEDGAILAARPAFRYETAGATSAVRSYYRARGRVPALNAAMWGAGVYALSRRGHERLGEFPDTTADDLVVDRLFTADEKRVLDVDPAIVRTPRTTAALLSILRRVRSGNSEQGVDSGGSTLRGLVRSIRGPRSAIDAAIYLLISARARSGSSASTSRWERDETSRA